MHHIPISSWIRYLFTFYQHILGKVVFNTARIDKSCNTEYICQYNACNYVWRLKLEIYPLWELLWQNLDFTEILAAQYISFWDEITEKICKQYFGHFLVNLSIYLASHWRKRPLCSVITYLSLFWGVKPNPIWTSVTW